MKKMLLVIDCQKAFINSFTKNYVEKINELIEKITTMIYYVQSLKITNEVHFIKY